MTMKIMRLYTALEINNAALKPVASSWTPLAANASPTAVGQEVEAWETWRSDKRKVDARELLAYLNTL